MSYYYADGDQQKGPATVDQLKSAGISPDTLVWRDGMADWTPAGKVPELSPIFARSAPTAPSPAAQPQHAPQPQYPQHQQYAQPQYPQPQQPVGYSQPQPYGQPAYPQMDYASGYTAPPSQGMSVASLVLGILAIPSTFCYGFGILMAILAIIFGHVGHSQYKRQTGQASGMAIAGLICGYISLSIVLLVFLFVFMLAGAAAAGR